MMTINKRAKTALRYLLVLVLVAFSTAAVSAAGSTVKQTTKPAVTSEVRNDTSYLYMIGPEDILEISVWRNDDLSKVVTVRPDGAISLPLIGDIAAAGRTPDELREIIIERLKEFQETVAVSVIVLEVNSYRIYILGEVVNPGSYLIKRRTSVVQAIAIAGGFNQYASKNKLVLIRERNAPGAREEKISIRFDDIVKAKSRQDNNMILKAGDTIYVP